MPEAVFAQWRRTRHLMRALDCHEALGLEKWEFNDRLMVYEGGVYITVGEGEYDYSLLLNHSVYSGGLAELEEILYGYATAEGLLE